MPKISVKLDKKRADRLARRSKVPKSDVIRALIDRAGPIETGEDLLDSSFLMATAESLNAEVVGADRAAFERLGARSLRFR